MAFIAAQMWPHRVAAFFARGRLYPKYHPDPEGSMAVLKFVPGFFLVGLNDIEDRVKGFREAEAYYKREKYPGAPLLEPGGVQIVAPRAVTTRTATVR